MFLYNILQAADIKIEETCIDNIFSVIKKQVSLNQSGTLNIVFVSNEEITELNTKYRDKKSATDVLSFHYYDDFSSLSSEEVA
jgi:ssRNA-specific RNase YbeY (16S rRNA maturation enzyme)